MLKRQVCVDVLGDIAAFALDKLITVNTLEVLASRRESRAAPRSHSMRHLGGAKLRLAGALKALAALSRLRKRVVVKQVNVANGAMLVDNRAGAEGVATRPCWLSLPNMPTVLPSQKESNP